MVRATIEWLAALAAAPLFVLFCRQECGSGNTDIFWLFADAKSFFFLLLLYPLLEELLFRGVLLELLQRRMEGSVLPGISRANLLSSLLFVLWHLPYHPIHWAVLTFFPSLVFGYFMERYRTISAPILLHSWYNLFYFSFFGKV